MQTIIISILFFSLTMVSLPGQTDKSLLKKASDIHQRIWTVDTHTDTPMRIGQGFDLGVMHSFEQKGSGRVDFPRMKKGGLDAIFFAIFTSQRATTPEGYAKAKQIALDTFKQIDKEMTRLSAQASLALTADDADKIEKSGKRAVYIGVENGYPIGEDIGMVAELYRLGARYITLCHTRHNQICDSSTDREPPIHQGLSPFGEKVVQEMNRLGMMIDISHMSDKSLLDVLRISKAPVIASHSSVRALCDNPRNLSDDLIRQLAAQGGVIQICLLSDYVKKIEQAPERLTAEKSIHDKFKDYDKLSRPEQEKLEREWDELDHNYPAKMATISDLIDHVDHIVKLVGVDFVGFGSDFDGGGGLADCHDVGDFAKITLALVKRGYDEAAIAKIWGGNFRRAMKAIEAAAKK